MNFFANMLAALGQPTRLAIFRRLVQAGPAGRRVEDIRRGLGLPGSTLSHHLDALASCGLLTARRDGRFIFYAVDWVRTGELLRFLLEDCCAGAPAETGPTPRRRDAKGSKPTARRNRK